MEQQANQQIITIGSFEIDTYRQTVSKNGNPIRLTRRMYDIVVYLAQQNGRPASSHDLVTHAFPKDVADNTAEVYVKYLRQALGETAIINRRGFGYLLNASAIA